MRFITNSEMAEILNYDQLIEALRAMFRSDYQMPLRHHHFYPVADGSENTLILMPAWNEKYLGNKQIILAPSNAPKGIPTVSALYTLFDVHTGQPLVMMNAEELTSRRTACTSALAADYLAPKNAHTLLILGGGKVAQHLIQAHSTVRDYKEVFVWMRNKGKFEGFLKKIPRIFHDKIRFADNLEAAAGRADVIAAATMTVDPIIRGKWLKEGVYLDMIGSYKPDMREADDEVIRRSQIYVDSRMGALHECGELFIPIQNGLIKESDVRADLTELCLGKHPGRKDEKQTILFKSAGLAIEDLAGALLAYERTK